MQVPLALALCVASSALQVEEPPLVDSSSIIEVNLTPEEPVKFRIPTGARFTTTIYVLADDLDTRFDFIAPNGSINAALDDEGGGTTPFFVVGYRDSPELWSIEVYVKGDVGGPATVHFIHQEETDETLALDADVTKARTAVPALIEAGKIDEALETWRSLAQRALAIEGAESSRRLFWSAERAGYDFHNLLYRTGRGNPDDYLLAARSLERALTLRERTLPPLHQHIDITQRAYSAFIGDADPDAARADLEARLERKLEAVPPDEAEIRRARGHLAGTLERAGRYSEALAQRELVLAENPRASRIDYVNLAKEYKDLLSTLVLIEDISARLTWAERALEELEGHLPEESQAFLDLRTSYASALSSNGRRPEALRIRAEIITILRRIYPESAMELLCKRAEYGHALWVVGRYGEALAELEDVHRRMKAQREEHSPPLVWVRDALTDVLDTLGRAEEALELVDINIRIQSLDNKSEADPVALRSRVSRARLLFSLDRRPEAWTEIERALAVVEQVDPQYLTKTRFEIWEFAAAVASSLGDLERARAIYDTILADPPEQSAHDHRWISARMNAALTLSSLGEKEEAVRRFLELDADLAASPLPDDHAMTRSVKRNLAAILAVVGRQEEALALLDRFPGAWKGAELARAQASSSALESLGRLEEAADRLASALGGENGSTDKSFAMNLRGRQIRILQTLARTEEAEAVARTLGEELLDWVQAMEGTAPDRVLDRGLWHHSTELSAVLAVAVESDDEALHRAAFSVAETLRGAPLVPPYLRQLDLQTEGVQELRSEVRALARRISDLTETAEAAVGEDRDRVSAKLDELVRERDLKNSELMGKLSTDPRAQALLARASVERVAAQLRDGEAAIGFHRYHKNKLLPDGSSLPKERHFAASIVRPDASLAWVKLGSESLIEEVIKEWSSAVGVGGERGVERAIAGPKPLQENESGNRLRSLLLDRVLEHTGGARRLVVEPEAVLHFLPLDALPLPDGGRLGDTHEIVIVESLRHLGIARPLPPMTTPTLLALGDVEYGSDLESEGEVSARSTSRFAPLQSLPATAAEVRGVAELFADSFEGGESIVLTGQDADAESLVRGCQSARFLHLATHGWFDEERMLRLKDDDAGMELGLNRRLLGYSPMSLCGLALSGANETREDGTAPGRFAAEELAGLDLSGCDLAVLSTCEGGIGIVTIGAGIASLQRALTIAGVRHSLTSIWAVPDEATRTLMVAFYEKLWGEGLSPRVALWEAKLSLRNALASDGTPRYSTRDWAGWILRGPGTE